MDLKDIEDWGREILQSEASKRGVKNAEVYSRAELVRMILRHDYGAPMNVRDAARLLGGLWDSAKNVMRSRLGSGAGTFSASDLRTYVGAARDAVRAHADASGPDRNRSVERGQMLDAEEAALREAARLRAEAHDTRRDSERVRADARASSTVSREQRASREPGWHDEPLTSAREFEVVGADPVGGDSRLSAADRSSGPSGDEAAAEPSRASSVEVVPVWSDGEPGPQQPAAASGEPEPSDDWADGAADAYGSRTANDAAVPSQSEVGRHEPPSAASSVGSHTLDDAPSSSESGVRPATEEVKQRIRGAGAAFTAENAPAHLRLVESPLEQPPSIGSSPWVPASDSDLQASPLSLHEVPRTAAALESIESATTADATAADSRIAAVASESATEHLSYGPHPSDGLLVRWRVTAGAIERARKVLGTHGELAVRIVAVRVDLHAVVKTDIIDHGPVDAAGDWTAPLLLADARYVSAIGLRSPTRFVSIVHAAS